MQIKIFTIPINESNDFMVELNKFIASNKIVEVEQQFVANGERSFWSFCVRYIAINSSSNNTPREKIDYKQVLSEVHFNVFSKLREIRRRLANDDAVPAYAVFTDEELSKIAILDIVTIQEVRKIEGIGVKKMEKYGEKLISIYNETAGVSD